MEVKVLVVYATRYGTTRRVARLVAELLEERGHVVDVVDASRMPDPRGYGLVVLGAPVYRDGPCSCLMEYVEARRRELEEVPKAFFLVAMHTVGSVFMGRLHGGIAYAQPLLDAFEAPPFYGTLIGGVVDPDRLSPEDRRKMERFYRALGEELRRQDKLRREDVEAFVRRTLLYYDWFGKDFVRGRVGEASRFDFMEKLRELGYAGGEGGES